MTLVIGDLFVLHFLFGLTLVDTQGHLLLDGIPASVLSQKDLEVSLARKYYVVCDLLWIVIFRKIRRVCRRLTCTNL